MRLIRVTATALAFAPVGWPVSYTIRFDEEQAVFRLTLTGFWGPEVFARFAMAFQATIERVMRDHVRFDTFANASAFQVQSINVAQGFDYLKRVAHMACPAARTAVIFGSALTRMQAKRAVMDDSMRVFKNKTEA